DRITRILNGRATPANQPLPPLMPGYDKSFAVYAYDVAKAKALLAEAGYPDGFETVLYSTNSGQIRLDRLGDTRLRVGGGGV
ncbi:ABC transporter substrate-binding protein, partial [Rhizobium leguminosarum]|uniref:ABC transporter substrate-binding protein n=1 Tax=Rhizobium leguminosarum TaxID=384 RepID=UPI003F94678B